VVYQDVGLGDHREQERVVVAVVGALHLHDLVPPRGGAGDAEGIHRRLGPGVDDANLLQSEPLADRFGERDRGGCRHREVDRLASRLLESFDDLRMGVADDVDAEAAVEVLVLDTVDVPDARTLAALEVDRIRVPSLEVRGHTVRQALHGSFVERVRARRPGHQVRGLSLRDFCRARRQPLQIHRHLLQGPGSVPAGRRSGVALRCSCIRRGAAAGQLAQR
jgi:hypothetical protein